MTKLTTTLQGKQVKQVVFLDIDNTLFLSNLETATYTGYSADRWHAFVELLVENGSLVGIITDKDRCSYYNNDNILNGLPDFQDYSSRYDDLGQRLFGYDGYNQSLRDLLSPELIYFMNRGKEGNKSDAILHAQAKYLGMDFSLQNTWLIDDDPHGKIQGPIENMNANFIKVPQKVYMSQNEDEAEECCISLMVNTLKRMGINPEQTPALYSRITHRYYVKPNEQEKSTFVDPQEVAKNQVASGAYTRGRFFALAALTTAVAAAAITLTIV